MRIRVLLLLLLSVGFAAAQAGPSNLDFEQGQPGEVPPGWFVPKSLADAGYNAAIQTEGCQNGQCVVITVPEPQPERMFGNLMASVDATPYRGKRVVFRAAVRAEKGTAMMWVRVDRGQAGMGFFDNMQDRPIQPGDWRVYEIAGAVDDDATRLNYGVMAHGNARVWVDEASVEFSQPPMVDTSEAREAIVEQYALLDRAYVNQDFEALRDIATADARIGSFMMKLPVDQAIAQIRKDYGGVSEFSHSTAIDSVQTMHGDVLVRTTAKVRMTKDGMQSSYLVSGRDIWTRADGTWRMREGTTTGMREVVAPDDDASVRRIAAALKKQVTPLSGVEAGVPYDDLAAFGKAVGDARVVALGEATHGTREIFQMKHRLLEYLVKEKGFTVFAIEANWPESQAADRYVKTGAGDPKAALRDMYFWTWQTEEVLAMLEWMREYNKSRGERPMLSFTSFDMQTYSAARDRVLAYVKQYAPDAVIQVEDAYQPLAKVSAQMRSNPTFADAAKGADEVIKLLEQHQTQLVAASSAEAHRNTVQTARIVAQAARMRAPGSTSSYRDEMMAKNVEWLLNHAYPGQKIVLWAHNGHVSTAQQTGFRPMGLWLREFLGTQMYVLGFAIHQGTVRAVTRDGEKSIGLVESPIPQAAAGTGTAVLSATGVPLFFLDLRRTDDDVAGWASAPHLFRSCGALWDRANPDNFMRAEALKKSYDGLIYIANTQAAKGI